MDHTLIARFAFAVLILVATPWSASAQATPSAGAAQCGPPSGWILTQTAPTADRQSTVGVIDPVSLRVTDEIDAPPIDSAFPTPMPGRALAIAGRDLFLIDVSRGTSTRIALPDGDARDLSPNPVQFRGTAGERFMLLGSPAFDRAILIDLDRRTAVSLPALIGATPETPVFVSFAAVTPGDAHVLFWDGRAVYLASTENPGEVQQISTAPFAFAPESSPDGREIVFSQSEGPGSGSAVVVHDIKTGATRELLARDRALVTLWPPGGRTLLVDARTESGAAAGAVSLLDIDSGEERVVLRYSGSLTTVQFNPDGSRALLGVERIDGGEWHLLDLRGGDVTPLPQLSGSRIYPGLYADARWALAVPTGPSDDPLTAPAFRSVDLETGAVARLLPRDPAATYLEPPVLSVNGRIALVTTVETTSRQWLLDAAAIDALEMPAGDAHLSPDACHVAVAVTSASSVSVGTWDTDGDDEPRLVEMSNARLLIWVD